MSLSIFQTQWGRFYFFFYIFSGQGNTTYYIHTLWEFSTVGCWQQTQRFILCSYFLACWMPASCLMDHEWVSFIQALSKVNLSSSTRFSVVQPLCLALLWWAQPHCFCISRFQLGCDPARLVSRESKSPLKRKKWWKLPGKISQTLQAPVLKSGLEKYPCIKLA